MRYEVVAAFHTDLRRFEPGTEIDGYEITGPVSADRWVEMGMLRPMEGADDSHLEPAAPPPEDEGDAA